METIEEVLAHYGVPGMKWGVRRKSSSSSGPSDVAVKAKPGHRVKTSGGKGHSPSEDAIRVSVSKQKARKSTTDSLSNKELKDLVERMNLEQQYSQLTQKNKKKNPAVKFAAEILLNVGKQQATKVVNDAATKQLGKMLANR